jgi:hypothetical protein
MILEEVLPALDGPHLPALHLLDDRLGERHEVRRARRRAGIEDEDVLRAREPTWSTPTLLSSSACPGEGKPSSVTKRTATSAAAAGITAMQAKATAAARTRRALTGLDVIRILPCPP